MANNLLLVDDSPLIHRVVELTFEGQGLAVHPADDAEEALALARRLKPDIVLASTEMKGAGGLDFCRRLRLEAELAEVPVVLLTTAQEGLSEGEVREAGAVGVLTKPFEPGRLLAEVDRALASGSVRGGAEPPSPSPATPSAETPPAQEPPPEASQEGASEATEEGAEEALSPEGSEEPPAELVAHSGQLSAAEAELASLQAELVADLEAAGEAELAAKVEAAGEAEAAAEGVEAAPAGRQPAKEAGLDEEALRPLLEKSLERTAEALVPEILRHIDSLVVEQLPDLVEKIVLREIEKIKRGE